MRALMHALTDLDEARLDVDFDDLLLFRRRLRLLGQQHFVVLSEQAVGGLQASVERRREDGVDWHVHESEHKQIHTHTHTTTVNRSSQHPPERQLS